jgi:hypothetical protein
MDMNRSQTVMGKLGNIERMLEERARQMERLSSLMRVYMEQVNELERVVGFLGKSLIELKVRVKKLEGK